MIGWTLAGEPKATALAMFCAAAFALAAVGQEFWRGARARRAATGAPLAVALATLVGRNRRRYGGYLVHVGMAVLFLGVAASSAFQDVRDVRLRPGQSVRVEGYDIRYVRATRRTEPREALAGSAAPGQQGRARHGDPGAEPWLLPVSGRAAVRTDRPLLRRRGDE